MNGIYFVHIMKTGGISLSTRLRELFGVEHSYPDFTGRGTDPTVAKYMVPALEEACRAVTPPFVTVHMPAWTAATYGPGHRHITVLRDPVSRTISHLRQIARSDRGPDTPRAAWDDADYRDRLTDYQTRIFAQERAAPDIDVAAIPRARLEAAMEAFRLTAMGDASPLTTTDLERAIDRLESFHLVGTTERLGEFTERLSVVCGAPIDPLDHKNAAPAAPPPPADLIADIERHTVLDRALYERAIELSRRAPVTDD